MEMEVVLNGEGGLRGLEDMILDGDGTSMILLELLQVRDICQLDVALCSHSVRRRWMETLELFSASAKMAPNVVCRPHVVEAKSMGQQKGRKVTIDGGHEGRSPHQGEPVWILKDEAELRWIATRMPRYRSLIVVNDKGSNPLPNVYFSELHYAARRFDDPDIIRLLARRKGAVDLDSQDHFGRTPLHIACQYGCRMAARALVGLGASVHILNNYGFTPEGSAHANGHRFALHEPIREDRTKYKREKAKDSRSMTFPIVFHRYCFY